MRARILVLCALMGSVAFAQETAPALPFICAHGPHRQRRQHLGSRQGLRHDHQVQSGGPRRLGVRAQERVRGRG